MVSVGCRVEEIEQFLDQYGRDEEQTAQKYILR